MTFGEKLKQARKESGYSQEQLANLLCVSRSAIAKWESGGGMPEVSNLEMIAKALSVSIDYLLDDGQEISLDVIKEPIDLENMEAPKGYRLLAKDRKKDAIVREKYPDDEIYMLLHEQIKNKKEKIIQTILWLTTPFANTVDIVHSFNNTDKTFFLVNREDRQYLVVVTDEFIESRCLTKRIECKRGKKFIIGEYKFINAGLLKV